MQFRRIRRPVQLPASLRRAHRARRGSAIILVMLATVGLAALALSAIFMSSSAVLMTQYYDKERDFRYAAEQAIQLGLAQMQWDTAMHLPDSGYVTLMTNAQLKDAYTNNIPTIRVNLYAGQTGTNTGQFGEFASLVAQAQDSLGNTRYVRRLEVEEDNFARFAMFTNQFSGGLCYGSGEFIKGVSMSNQIWQSCTNPTYYDTVSAHTTVNQIGSPPATFVHGYKQNVPAIPMPTVAKLANLPTYAANANFSFTSVSRGTRIEFVAINMNPNGVIDTTETDPNEGFFRVFNDTAGNNSGEGVQGSGIDRAYAYYNDSSTVNGWAVYNDQCGDWHTVGGRVMFFPAAVHNQAWFKAAMIAHTITQPWAFDTSHTPMTAANRVTIMAHTTPRQARCYPAGDPHLVAVERSTASGYAATDTAKGGEDSTFTPVNRSGYWTAWPGTVPPGLSPAATCGVQSIGNQSNCPPGINTVEETYLFPLYRGYNPNTKGVIYFNGDVAASGLLNGFVTLYSSGSVWFTDDLVYTTNPTVTVCANELGVIAANNLWIPNNAMNRPQNPTTPSTPTGTANSYWMSDNQNFYLDGVTIAIGVLGGSGSFQVENYGGGALAMTTCSGHSAGGGCIDQIGGVIEQFISATWNGTNSGFPENRSVDPCLVKQSPPYFPVTGKYAANRYYELDPAQFNVDSLYKDLQKQ